MAIIHNYKNLIIKVIIISHFIVYYAYIVIAKSKNTPPLRQASDEAIQKVVPSYVRTSTYKEELVAICPRRVSICFLLAG